MILSVPNANPAMPCAPPILYISSTPQISAETKVRGSIFPSFFVGDIVTILLTPANFAGVTHIISVLGYLADPPGT